MTTNNPLQQYFRQPAIYVKLPSQGKFYPDGTLNTPATGEYPVYPMTAIDEITYRTPDAMFNGQATVSVIQSCLPDILDAWHVPAADLDTILVAIRIASYGHEMEFGSQCPACKAKADRSLDLRLVLDRLVAPDYTQSIKSGDMEIYFRPMNYKDLTENSRLQYENQKLLQMIPDDADDINSEKITALSNALKRITEVTVTALAKSISMVKTPNAMVTEPHFIEEMLGNCDRKLFNQIREYILELKAESEIKPLQLTCDECKHEYEQLVTLDMSSFFGVAS
jgi:hypothetical protein